MGSFLLNFSGKSIFETEGLDTSDGPDRSKGTADGGTADVEGSVLASCLLVQDGRKQELSRMGPNGAFRPQCAGYSILQILNIASPASLRSLQMDILSIQQIL
jgi:hypothetical protein